MVTTVQQLAEHDAAHADLESSRDFMLPLPAALKKNRVAPDLLMRPIAARSLKSVRSGPDVAAEVNSPRPKTRTGIPILRR